MIKSLADLSLDQLKKALALKEEIEALEMRLSVILGCEGSDETTIVDIATHDDRGRPRKLSPEERAIVASNQMARLKRYLVAKRDAKETATEAPETSAARRAARRRVQRASFSSFLRWAQLQHTVSMLKKVGPQVKQALAQEVGGRKRRNQTKRQRSAGREG